MHQAIADWQAGTADWVTAWDVKGETCRAAFGELIGAQPESIALVPSGSVGVGLVAATLQRGDTVIVPDDEFTSVLYPLLVAAERTGATVRPVPFQALAQSIEPATT